MAGLVELEFINKILIIIFATNVYIAIGLYKKCPQRAGIFVRKS
jgi:hypothetical protein